MVSASNDLTRNWNETSQRGWTKKPSPGSGPHGRRQSGNLFWYHCSRMLYFEPIWLRRGAYQAAPSKLTSSYKNSLLALKALKIFSLPPPAGALWAMSGYRNFTKE